MDPGGSDLEPDLSQIENPCLIVEDSQPDSAALEEDPESSYCALLARRLSSLQPTSPSPVLELISSPAGSRCSQTESQTAAAQSNKHPSPASLDSPCAVQEDSQVFDVCPPANLKRDLPPSNRKRSGEGMEMDAGADSTTPCVQSEGRTSQFGFLALSESQGLRGEIDGGREGQGEEPAAAGRADGESRGCAKQGAEESKAEGQKPDSRNSASRRSEVSSSCPPEPTCLERKERSIQNLLHAQALEAEEGGNDGEVPSSQDDLFEEGRSDTGGVDSTVPEAESLRLPTSTPANTLHLLHLSGQGTLVQESLSQNSLEFVAPTQERLSQTPLIVPNSPMVQAHEAVEEPMDTSVPPEEPEHPSRREEEPMEMDHAPSQSDPKLPPTASTPVSRNSPGFVLEKTLPLPSQPDFSHDIFVPTQSQEGGGGSTGPDPLMKKDPSERRGVEPATEHEASLSAQSHPSVTVESFRLELSTISETTAVAQQARELEEEEEGEQEDSQATQIEEFGEAVGTASSKLVLGPRNQQKDTGDFQEGLKNSADSPKVSQVPDLISSSSRCDSIELNATNDTKPDLESGLIRPAVPATDVVSAAQGIDLTDSRASQKRDAGCAPNVTNSQQKLEAVGLTANDALKCGPPQTAREAQASLASQSQSRSILKEEEVGLREDGVKDVVMEARSRSPDVREVSGSEAEASPLAAFRGPENEGVADEEKMDEEAKPEGTSEAEQPGLCLSLSQSQMLSPEPMEEDDSPLPQEQGVLKETVAAAQEEPAPAEEEEEDEGSGAIVVEESERDSQPQSDKATASRSADLSVPMHGVPMVPAEDPQKPTSLAESPAEKAASSRNGTEPRPKASNPAADGVWQSEKATPPCAKNADRGAEENSGYRSPSNSSGEVPFHFTLPKEGEVIRPVANVTPPLLSQLKKTPRHSTPIEMTSFSERSAEETTMAASDITVEESREENKTAHEKASEHDGKLSLRMKLVTPVEESSSVSEHFSLQKPALFDDEGSVAKVTTVVKAVTSPMSVPSVFSRVCEVRREEEVQEKAQANKPSTPTRGGLFNLPSSQVSDGERAGPGPLTQRLRNLPRSNAVFETSQSEELSPRSGQEGSMPASPGGSSGPERASPHLGGEEEPPAGTVGASRADGPAGQPGPEEGATPAPGTPRRQRAVSQQTSFDTHASPSLPSKLRQRAVSQQTSFEAHEPHFPMAQGDLEMPPLHSPHGQALHRHVRTIREVRTTVTRIITDVYYENGREVDRKVTEECEEPVVDCRVMENDISPSRTGSSLTSGDLADVSSFSSKTSSLQHSSSGTSSTGGGPAKHADFIIPVSRGGKSASPRKASGQQQRAHCGPGGSEWMEDRGRAPLTPRGRGRRGRPPSRSPFARGTGNQPRDSGRAPISSSEEEPNSRACPRVAESLADAPDSPEAVSNTSGGSNSFVGLRVVAKWSSNGYFYSGCITRDSGAGRFRLLFDDRYECDVPGKDILLCDPIPLETEVTALSEDEYFSTGVVKGYKTEGSDFFYCVEKDGQRKWYGRMAVILSMEQGNRLREQYGLGPYEPTTPLTKASDISLDNLVEGKRKRRGNSGGVGTPTRSSGDSPRTPGPSGKRKSVTPAEEDRTPAKRGRKSAGPRTGQRVNVCNTSGSGTDLPSDPGDLLETHGPLPQSATLFLGYAFLLTASSEHDRKTNQQTSDGEEEYVQTAPYNKRYTESQLEAGGGFILQDFSEEQCNAAYQSILIADQHCRTEKYLLCLASGIPCVSHMWVRDCCHDNKLLNYRNYLLPAGMGPGDRIVEWHPRCCPFQSLKILLVFEQPADFLIKLIRMGGAASVFQHKADCDIADTAEGMFDLVVTDRSCPPPVLNWAILLDLPIVAPEWLIQSLICGEKLGYRSHAQYQYDYSP
ncbi:TP53-binding protein 1 isoform X3 [Scleropages formosus]|uniref:TP53-binding protein 1 n=1 Tax=Scleropages formosus TaxID=113540 RepID=A0A8C9WIG0_SCLFO|nr:TP53-binding protein 1 isoform X3 [Scleropages formosus]